MDVHPHRFHAITLLVVFKLGLTQFFIHLTAITIRHHVDHIRFLLFMPRAKFLV
ncbi:Uncharacterised protein [Vibrio cholerae]|nr:Uncharacterised protein [Vibrio cholerae]CSB14993.1 Uncharacterised protein [Vibrio cholerae]CSB56865.1 Uncharacterised protein [Vibrio cholerae]CSD30377.1 Uncharacterised protein [Vibrio cholerae]